MIGAVSVVRPTALVLALSVLTGCSFFQGGDQDDDARSTAWQEERHPSYRWTVVWTEPVFGPFPMEILVRDGVPVRALSNNEKLRTHGDQVEGRPGTVDALIEWLARYSPDAASVDVEWAPAGYPSRIELDHSDAIDDEITIAVEEFVRMDSVP
jgi:Family of unknown function (DUF6174)